MAWTNPKTWVAGIKLTAAELNTHVRDNLLALRDHKHDGNVPGGEQAIGPLTTLDLTDAAAPGAPGAGLSRFFALTGGYPGFRSGAAGAARKIAETTVDGLDLANHDARHAPGGADEIAALADHNARHEPGGADPMAVDAAAATGSLRTLGTGAQQAAAGNHATTHASTTGQTANDHHNQAHAIDGADHTGYIDLTTAEAFLGADVTSPTHDTWQDGPSVSLGVGTWLITAHCQIKVGGQTYTAVRLYNGTTVKASKTYVGQAATNGWASLTLVGIVTVPSGTETWKIQTTGTTSGGGGLMATNASASGATSQGNNATGIHAVKVGG